MIKKKALTLSVKILVGMAFLIAATMNFIGPYGAYTLAKALVSATTPPTETRLVLERIADVSIARH